MNRELGMTFTVNSQTAANIIGSRTDSKGH